MKTLIFTRAFKRQRFYWSVDVNKLPEGIKVEDVEKSRRLLRKYGEKVKWD